MAQQHVDVVLATDLRLPGGTAQSVANEARAQHAAGLTTGLVAIASPLARTAPGFAPAIKALLNDGIATLIDPSDAVSCDVAILRHPAVAEALDVSLLPHISTQHGFVIANQVASVPKTTRRSDQHTTRFDPAVAHTKAAQWLNVTPLWCPISPLVRDDLLHLAPSLPLSGTDWVNIIAGDSWHTQRSFGRHAVPVIGRHSRDDVLKWPAKQDLFRVYPTDTSVEVAVLGGLDALTRIAGEIPRLWRSYPFSSVDVKQFLASLDVYVYFHHPAWKEAFGRTILEALASGLPTVLDHTFAPLFGDACVYTDVSGVKATIAALTDSEAVYAAQVDAGLTAVAQRFSFDAHSARLAPYVTATPRSYAGVTLAPKTKRRVLFVSSNGAGVGHLMRLMAYAKHAPDTIEPLFLTLSQGVKVVDDAGYFVEYLPSRGVSDAPARDWHPLLRNRLLELFDRYAIDAVVFDGTWPYQGLLDALILSPNVRFIWSRRALWKRGVRNPFLTDQRQLTDLILEPGDAADSHDTGATVARRREATRVTDVRFVDDKQMLDAAYAKSELNIDPAVTAVLVNLGAGNINDTSDVVGALVARLGREPNTAVYLTRSIIANDTATTFSHVHPLSVYPLAKYLHAFDYAFAASGYNSFHELLAASVPTGWVANTDTATDDQAARARYAAHVGIGVDATAATPEVLASAVDLLGDFDVRQRMRQRMRQRQQPNGAPAAMQAIVDVLDAPYGARRHSMSHLASAQSAGLGALLPARLRAVIDTLRAVIKPATYRRYVRRFLRRLPRRVRTQIVTLTPAAKRSQMASGLGLITHVALPLAIKRTSRRVMVVCDETRTQKDTELLVAAVGHAIQARDVAVLMVLRTPTFAAVREHRLVAEYVPTPARFARVSMGETVATVLAGRLNMFTQAYGITDIVTVDPKETPASVVSRTLTRAT